MIVVYLSNQNIRVVEGEYARDAVKIKGMHHVVDTEGCIINGSVTEKEGLQKLLKELWEKEGLARENVVLVVNSSQFTTKVLEVPVMRQLQTLEYIKREFADVERIEDPIHTYFPMPGQKKGKIQSLFAGVVSRDFLEVYQSLFEEIGIHLVRIEMVSGSLLRMIDSMEAVKGRTCIIQFYNEATLIDVLYVGGRHMYSSRVRLFSEPGTSEFAVEAARSVSSILQFAKSQNMEEPIREVFVAGMEQEMMDAFADSVQSIGEHLETKHLDLGQIFRLPEGDTVNRLEHYILSLGAFWPVPDKMGFLAQLTYDPEAEEQKQERRKAMIPLAALAVVLVAATVILGSRVVRLKEELAEVQAFNEDPAVAELCRRYDQAGSGAGERKSLLEEAEKLKKTIEGYPAADSGTAAVIASCADSLVDASLVSYQSEDGILAIDAAADQAEKIHQFVGRLEEQELFEEIGYTGYRQTDEGIWAMTIECKMKGRQAEDDGVEREKEADAGGEN